MCNPFHFQSNLPNPKQVYNILFFQVFTPSLSYSLYQEDICDCKRENLFKEAILCSFFGFIFYFWLLLEQVYMLWCSKNSSVFSYSWRQQPCFFLDFCLCLRRSVLAPAPPLKAYSALIGQFKHTPSRWTYSEAQHTVMQQWSEI